MGIAAALELLALFIWLDANQLPAHLTAGVGPAAAMRLVAVFIAVLGVAHALTAWRRKTPTAQGNAEQEDIAERTNHAALAWILCGLLVLGVCVHLGGGFILGATALFVGTARAFGQALGLRSLGIGLTLTTLVFLFFARVLTLSLPIGPLEQLLLP